MNSNTLENAMTFQTEIKEAIIKNHTIVNSKKRNIYSRKSRAFSPLKFDFPLSSQAARVASPIDHKDKIDFKSLEKSNNQVQRRVLSPDLIINRNIALKIIREKKYGFTEDK